MLRLFRQLLSWFQIGRARFHVVYVKGHAEAKAAAGRSRTIALVGDADTPKWAYLQCPCGCGEALPLNLMRSHHPRWEITIAAHRFPTLSPSVLSTTCGAHFWIKSGVLSWAEAPPTSAPRRDPRHRDPTARSPRRSTPPSARV